MKLRIVGLMCKICVMAIFPTSPVYALDTESRVSAVVAGTYHSLFIQTDGSLWAAGHNTYSQIGDGTTDDRTSPFQITSGVAAAAAGNAHTAYVKTDGSLWVLGGNVHGQFGDNTTDNSMVPLQVAVGVTQVAAGDKHTLFIKSDASLWGMGSNYYGQLGDGTTSARYLPYLIASGVSSVAASVGHTAFVKTDGSLWTMGWNNKGQLGTGDVTNRKTPVQVATGVRAVKTGKYHTLFLKTNGELWGMGTNEWKQLGGTVNQPFPVLIAANVTLMAAGNYHSMFTTSDSTLWVMGSNSHGQLGNGTRVSQSTPIAIASNVAAIAAGEVHSMFVKHDGSLWATGSNVFGQLGDGTETLRERPVRVVGPASSISTLSGLSLSAGNLNPVFSPETLSYSVSVPNRTATFNVTPMVTEPATVTVNDVDVEPGAESGEMSLAVGSNAIHVEVIAEDGVSSTTYRIVVTREAASSVATLSKLAIAGVKLSPKFNSMNLTYSAKVSNSTRSLKITPTTTGHAVVKVNGFLVRSGSVSRAIAMKVGRNTVSVSVTAQNGSTKTYKITVTRAAPAKLRLSNSLIQQASAPDAKDPQPHSKIPVHWIHGTQ